MVARRPSRQLSVFGRVLAIGCVLTIFALSVLAASPSLHERLHHGTGTTADDGCAIVQFATGVTVLLTMAAVTPRASDWQSLPYPQSAELVLISPRYRLQPERGPPAA
ncbi:MAG TPA: hypothetical protein VGM73_15940 [Candidatus Didemnitutus sp.]|jgi:hypothetical protein